MRKRNFSGMPGDQLTQLPPDIRTMVMAGSTAMMVGMGGEMGMDGVGVGLGAGAPQQGQGGLIPDQMGAVVEGFSPQGGMGVCMGMPEYGIEVRFDSPSAMPLDRFVKRWAN